MLLLTSCVQLALRELVTVHEAAPRECVVLIEMAQVAKRVPGKAADAVTYLHRALLVSRSDKDAASIRNMISSLTAGAGEDDDGTY